MEFMKQGLTTSDESLLFFGERVWGGVPFLDGKKEKFEDNSEKTSILTTFGATKVQKRFKRD
jgi:hypothetical protein